jgi:hypothetical protein
MALMPCFEPGQAHAEGLVIGRLLAGYGEIELEMCACLIAVEGGIYDIPIREIFTDRGAEKRIGIGRKALSQSFANANLTAVLTDALDDMEWCRQIRNQYSHCHWYWTAQEGLCFINLEELAKQPTAILQITANRHPIDVPLLQQQEDYFWYVKQCFMHLGDAYKAWDQAQTQGGARRRSPSVYPKPPKIAQPPTHN